MAIERHGGVVVVKAIPQGVPLKTGEPWAGVPGAAPLSIEQRVAFRAKERTMNDNRPVIKMRTLTRMEHPEDGRRLEPPGSDGKGAEFEVHSEQTALTLVEKRLAERLSPEAPSEEEAAEASAAQDLNEPWTMQMSPEAYIERWPDGPNVAHARAVIEREAAK